MRYFSHNFLTYGEITSIRAGIKKGATQILMPIKGCQNIHYNPINVVDIRNNTFKLMPMGDCNVIMDIPNLIDTFPYRYVYNMNGDMDVSYLKPINQFNDLKIEFETCRKIHPVKTIKFPTHLKLGDIILSCPGSPALNKIKGLLSPY